MGLLSGHFGGAGASGKKPVNGLLAEDAFHQVLERERALADRHGRFFSLLLVDLSDEHTGTETPQLLGRVVLERLRKTDLAGWVDSRRIGIILPYTHAAGATIVADDIRARMQTQGAAVRCECHTYPPDTAAPENPPPSPAAEDSDAQPSTARPDPQFSALLAPRYPFWKRALDIVISLAALILLSPVMLMVALLIKAVSPGPALFRQARVGHLQQNFTCWKFRTMHLNADTGVHRVHFDKLMRDDTSMVKLDDSGDARLIPFGKFLRASGLDELPQLFNVLRGDMSIIGPRPCIEYEFNNYERWQKRRCDTRPGLTGLWQVSGKNKTTFNEMMRYDISYSDRKTLRKDLSIIVRTFPAIVGQVKDMLRKRRHTDGHPTA